MAGTAPPLIGLPSDTFEKDELLFHSVGDKYLRAIADVAGCLPVMIPSLGDEAVMHETLDQLDGIVMTGATSNVYPPRYGFDPTMHHEPFDRVRDETTLNLIHAVLEREMPLLCICRGFQELNVALGGTLDTEIQTMPNRMDHRAPASDDLDIRYGPVHTIQIRPDGPLAKIVGEGPIMVNTVHRQAIRDLAPGLTVEAIAPDDTIEAVSVDDANGFALGVQWHPEYKAANNPHSVKLFRAFGIAAASYQESGRKGARPMPAPSLLRARN